MADKSSLHPGKSGRAGRAAAVTPPTEAAQAAREARLAKALRENLRRRKTQSRARRPAGTGSAPDED
jgi:hypothetical protein